MDKKFDGPHEAHAMGGKTSWANRTPEERSAHARKMVRARERRRKELKKAA